jgi:hypothetical protein
MRLEFALPDQTGHYAFRVGSAQHGGFTVQNEECYAGADYFRVKEGKVSSCSVSPSPAAAPDRLYLVHASGLPPFRPLYEALSRMGFYNLNPDRIRDLQPPDPGELLARDGGNTASVLSMLAKKNAAAKERVEEFLSKVVPGIRGVDVKHIGPKETLEFRQDIVGSSSPWRFLAANMSDGTLRALSVLVALFQSGNGAPARVPLVGIEEPEVALHPAAVGVLLDGLREASMRTQVIVTSHSPDLLDDDKIDSESICAVDAESGTTSIARIDDAGRTALKDRLYTAGELLRLNQLNPDPKAVPDPSGRQLKLFEEQDDNPE